MQNHTTESISEQLDRDFSRDVWCILGLPFDRINMKEAVETVVLAATEKKSCFVSTPNLNFLCAAQNDADFRQSVLNSDLSIADGMPVILLAKLLNIPITERVAGSDLINSLTNRKTDKPIKVFFFGGGPRVAEQASLKINTLNSGLISVGYYDPGFVTVENMSTEAIIEEINSYDIDFLIISLGAKKGQAWIEKNRDKLNSPVISHLGAVVNFLAGTIIRAPSWMQQLGLEWFWRIYQEPWLWKRYLADGTQLLGILFRCVIPYCFWLRYSKNSVKSDSENLLSTKVEKNENITTIFFTDDCCRPNTDVLRKIFKQLVLDGQNVVIDLRNVTVIDGEFLALCMLLRKNLMKSGKTMGLANISVTVGKILKWNKAQYLLQ